MKKINYKPLFTFIIGALIFGSIGIYATSTYYAKNISYEPNSNWEVSNVNDALDELYKSKTTIKKGMFVFPVADVGSVTIDLGFRPTKIFTFAENMAFFNVYDLENSLSLGCGGDVEVCTAAFNGGLTLTDNGFIVKNKWWSGYNNINIHYYAVK